MPMEQKHYEDKVIFETEWGTQCLTLDCFGFGIEPHLELDQRCLEFEHCLPYTELNERVLTVNNPCDFPIEFFCKENDTLAIEVRTTWNLNMQ